MTRVEAVIVAVCGAVLVAATAALVWIWQERKYEAQLNKKDATYQSQMAAIAKATAEEFQRRAEQRKDLEQRLSADESLKYGELQSAKKTNQALRDRLSTAELRLSVVLKAGPAGSCNGQVSGTTTGTSLDDGTVRGYLQPETATAILDIGSDADRCAIKLKALQDREREIQSAFR